MADDKRFKKSPKPNWQRSGGAFGDTSMEEMDDYIEKGSGVVQRIESVGSDPNAGVGSKRRDGAE